MPVQYRRAGRTVWRYVHGTVLVLPMAGRPVVALADAGADLWQLLSEPLTANQAAHRLAEVYDTSAEEIMRDIAPVLDDLASSGVLERLDPA